MFELAEAVRFDRVMSVGRTKPLLLECQLQDGSLIEVVAKFSKGCSVEGLIREALVAMLATDLGLPVPAPYLVQVSEQFIDSIPVSGITDFLRASDGYGFGSRRLPDGYGQWTPSDGRMIDALEKEAVEIMCLDCWLPNSDRRVINPNLLTNGRSFAIFDHELALMGSNILFWKQPWLSGALDQANPPNDHIFFQHLCGRSSYETDDLVQRLSAISDLRVSEYVDALPESWVESNTVAIDARKYIIDLRVNISAANVEINRALS